MVNVGLVILHADAARGGAERYTLDLAGGLAGRGCGVSLLASSFVGETAGGVKRVCLASPGLTRLARYHAFLSALGKHLDGERYGVVHAMLPVAGCDVYHPHAGLAAEAIESGHLKHPTRLRRAAARIGMRLNPRRRSFAAVERRLLEAPEPPVVVCLSEYVKGTVLKHYPGLPAARLATVFNAVDLGRFDPGKGQDRFGRRASLGICEGDVVALIVAQDFQRKGVPQAVEATRRVNAGRGGARERLKLLVVGAEHAAAVEGDVVYAGATSNILPFYAAADFFVLPTRHDPCSLVVLEALAMGLPVISTRFNGACEVMTGYGEGSPRAMEGVVLDDPADVEALAGAMRELLDVGTRRRMSAAAVGLRPRLSYEHHLDEVLRIYQGLCTD